MHRTSVIRSGREDLREKIELGGLIVKAGLHHEKHALLLGVLVDFSRRLGTDESERERLTALGAEVFGSDGD